MQFHMIAADFVANSVFSALVHKIKDSKILGYENAWLTALHTSVNQNGIHPQQNWRIRMGSHTVITEIRTNFEQSS